LRAGRQMPTAGVRSAPSARAAERLTMGIDYRERMADGSPDPAGRAYL
jgi:hypothetical protein